MTGPKMLWFAINQNMQTFYFMFYHMRKNDIKCLIILECLVQKFFRHVVVCHKSKWIVWTCSFRFLWDILHYSYKFGLIVCKWISIINIDERNRYKIVSKNWSTFKISQKNTYWEFHNGKLRSYTYSKNESIFSILLLI